MCSSAPHVRRYVQEEVVGFVPAAAHLDYPAALTAPPAERQTGAHFTGLYATIPATLTLLSRVYLCIDRTVFDGLATEARARVARCCCRVACRASYVVLCHAALAPGCLRLDGSVLAGFATWDPLPRHTASRIALRVLDTTGHEPSASKAPYRIRGV